MRPVRQLDTKVILHSFLSEDCDENPLLSSGDLTLLRSIVNSLGYLSSTRPDILSALGTIARGQASGRKRHLVSARTLVNYVNTKRRGFELTISADTRAVVQVGIGSYFDANLTSNKSGIFPELIFKGISLIVFKFCNISSPV